MMLKPLLMGLSALAFMTTASVPAFAKSWIDTPPASARTFAELTTGAPVVMRTDKAFADIMVADAKIADVVVLTDKSFHLVGKTGGKTNIMLYDAQKRLIDIVDVNVGYDMAAIKKGLFETFPGEPIEVRPLAGGVYLSGNVSNANIADRAYSIAQSFAPNSVTNGLVVKDSHQVLLQVRFVEASRGAVKDLGVGLLVQSADGSLDNTGGLLGAGAAAARALIDHTLGTASLDFTIDALEEQGVVRTLAEPNLVAMSGETASFLAGGEFPFPIENGNGGVAVQFRQFGVSLAFTPTVLDDGIINLKVAPEVSQLDPTSAVSIGGIAVPGLSVRRANTTVELRNGQSFAIAGLLQNTRANNKTQVPWLGDVPILGSLFRSTGYKNNETELVLIVTPKLVRPVSDISQLATPLDQMRATSEARQFLLGQIDDAPLSAASGNGTYAKPASGGLAGQYGHVIN